MRKMIACTVAVLLLGSVLYNGADARPQAKTAFGKKYTTVAANHKINCEVCHIKGDKTRKKRNNYGEALAKVIKKKEKDKAKINEALTKTEKEKSAVKDKTFGDLLDEGKLPASK